MAPWHVRRISRKASAAISRIGADEIDSRHLSAKTVVKNVAHGTLGQQRRRINAQLGIALSRGRRVRDQRAIQRRIPLELRASWSVLIRQSDARVRIADHQIIQECVRNWLRQPNHQTQARTSEPILYSRKRVIDHAPLWSQNSGVPIIVDVTKGKLRAFAIQGLIDPE